MTVLVALRKSFNKEMHTIYATDSRITSDEEIAYKVSNNHKYVEFEKFTVLWCGSAVIQQVLENLRSAIRKNPKKFKYRNMRSIVDAQDMSAALLKAHKKLHKKGDPDAGDFNIIIITDSGFYSPAGAFVEKRKEIAWGGSGGSYISGMLIAEYDKVSDLKELKDLAHRAVATACQLRSDCGPPIVVKEYK